LDYSRFISSPFVYDKNFNLKNIPINNYSNILISKYKENQINNNNLINNNNRNNPNFFLNEKEFYNPDFNYIEDKNIGNINNSINFNDNVNSIISSFVCLHNKKSFKKISF